MTAQHAHDGWWRCRREHEAAAARAVSLAARQARTARLWAHLAREYYAQGLRYFAIYRRLAEHGPAVSLRHT